MQALKYVKCIVQSGIVVKCNSQDSSWKVASMATGIAKIANLCRPTTEWILDLTIIHELYIE